MVAAFTRAHYRSVLRKVGANKPPGWRASERRGDDSMKRRLLWPCALVVRAVLRRVAGQYATVSRRCTAVSRSCTRLASSVVVSSSVPVQAWTM